MRWPRDAGRGGAGVPSGGRPSCAVCFEVADLIDSDRSVSRSVGRVRVRGLLALLALAATACRGGPLRPSGFSPPSGDNQTVLSWGAAFAGSTHGCALANGGRALCWGSGGELGDGTLDSSPTPIRVQGPQTFLELDLSSYTCGLTTNAQAWCWGVGTSGRLGDGTTEDRLLPTAVVTNLRFSDLSTGAIHTCALDLGGELYCWGSNRFGQLGPHPDSVALLPVPLAPGRVWSSLDAGGLHTCALAEDGIAQCWGDAWGSVIAPIDGGTVFERISLGGQHACGLTADGEAWCFGSNTEGQLGDGTFDSTPPRGPPVPVDTELRFIDISAGEFHTCALTADGGAYCWGRDDLGQLGDGDPSQGTDPRRKPAPTRVLTPNSFVDFISISSGRFTSCGVSENARAYCWGFGTGSASASFSTRAVEIGT